MRRILLLALFSSVIVATQLGSTCSSSGPCVHDSDCDDSVFCNGVEQCMPGAADVDDRGCRPGPVPCLAGDTCNEDTKRCTNSCSYSGDQDGDGSRSEACGGLDCDDTDMQRFPGNVEVCDASGHDEDCDPSTFGDRDADGDGHIDAACCNMDGSTMICGDDCDDARPGTNPDVPEVCDGIDNDCDGSIDEGVMMTVYIDFDRDGYGTGDAMQACSLTPGFSWLDNDCDDKNVGITPGVLRCSSATQYQECKNDGTWTTAADCPGAQPTCTSQPNGTGTCE